MAERALVLSADPWEMQDDRTGEIRKGYSLWYLNSYRESEMGQKPTKVSVDLALLAQVRGKLPGVFELEYGSRPGSQNKATLTVVGMRQLASVDLADLCAKAAAPKAS